MKKIVIIMCMLIVAAGSLFAVDAQYQELLKTIDERSNFSSDLTATVTISTQDPEEGSSSQTVQMFRRDSDDVFLMLIQEPVVQLGQGYLRVEDSLWFYDPESRKFTHTSMSENFGDTDAKNSDFGTSSLADDYTVVSAEEGRLGNFSVYIMDLEAVHNEVTYPYMTIYVTQSESLLLKSEDYSLSERLLRTSYYPSYSKVGESYLASRTILVDELVENKITEMTKTNISGNEIPDYVFTKAYVEQVNR